ncbi:MAG: CoA transferase [Hyphomicrobiales bacterium]|nr:CoA transferase [Hyphomicrobiales bacterium]
MNDSLAGITVVAVEQAVAAPYASSRLADAGARVIKIERREGDFARDYDRMVRGQSAYFVWLNRGKESVCLDIKSPDDRLLLEHMIAEADVFIQNLKPGSLQQLGLGHASLSALHPRLITCDITGFGSSGPRSHLKAYDLIVQAEAGLCSITGNSVGPARVGVSVCDIAAGMTAHSAILQALFARERTGRGSNIQISLFDAVADWMNVPFLQHVYARHETVRAGVSHPSLAPYGAFRCNDGHDVIFSVQNDREWLNFCTLFLSRPDLVRHQQFADNSARIANRAALELIIGKRFTKLNSIEAMSALEAAGLAYGELNDIGKLTEHPHLRTIEVETPNGLIDIIAPPAVVDGQVLSLRPVSALGQHTDAIKFEFLQRRA